MFTYGANNRRNQNQRSENFLQKMKWREIEEIESHIEEIDNRRRKSGHQCWNQRHQKWNRQKKNGNHQKAKANQSKNRKKSMKMKETTKIKAMATSSEINRPSTKSEKPHQLMKAATTRVYSWRKMPHHLYEIERRRRAYNRNRRRRKIRAGPSIINQCFIETHQSIIIVQLHGEMRINPRIMKINHREEEEATHTALIEKKIIDILAMKKCRNRHQWNITIIIERNENQSMWKRSSKKKYTGYERKWKSKPEKSRRREILEWHQQYRRQWNEESYQSKQ